MKQLKINFWTLLILSIVFVTSCSDDDDYPIIEGSNVTVSNTFQSSSITAGVETTIEELFQMDAGSLAASASIAEAVEFPAYLLGLYDIDIDDSSISFDLVAPADDPTYGSLFRTLEAGTVDRYYLTFDEAQNVSGFTSSTSAVNLRIDSDRVLVVEIGEGFSFNPGSSFTITLE